MVLKRVKAQKPLNLIELFTEMASNKGDSCPFEYRPIAFVERISDRSFSEFSFDFCSKMQTHSVMKTGYDIITYTPRLIRFHPILRCNDGSVFFPCSWSRITKHTTTVLEEYCKRTRRRLGWYDPNTKKVDGLPKLNLDRCQLINDGEFEAKTEGDLVDIETLAKSILRKRTTQMKEVQSWNVSELDPRAKKTQAKALSVFKKLESELIQAFGPPAKLTKLLQKRIAVNGIQTGAIWHRGKKCLFLVLSNEDCGLPFYLTIGWFDGT